MIMNAGLPDEVQAAVEESYEAISNKCDSRSCSVAVRSSATAEDLPTASFAGKWQKINILSKLQA